MCVLSRSVLSDCLRPHGLQPATLLCPRGFSRQEYWSGLPCPPPGDLPNPGIEPRSPELQVDGYFTLWATREAHSFCHSCEKWIKIWKMQNCHANKWISHKAELQQDYQPVGKLLLSFFFLKKKIIYLFGFTGSYLWHMESLVGACGI